MEPKARSHAGSSDWKNSSGWKKVVTQKALMSRMMMMLRRKAQLFCDEGDAMVELGGELWQVHWQVHWQVSSIQIIRNTRTSPSSEVVSRFSQLDP